jgi:hypothetical protein
MSMAWITSMYGGYDTVPVSVRQHEPHMRIIVTDDMAFTYPIGSYIDEIVVETRLHMHPRMGAKFAKCLPWTYTDADVIVWTDASIRAIDSEFLSWMLHNREPGHCLSQFIHPHRNDIMEEAKVSMSMEKYAHQDIRGQVQQYTTHDDFPRNWGLWATGWAVWDLSTPKLRAEAEVLGEAWLLEQMRWTYQDQISQPYVSWKHGIPIGTLPGDIFSPPHSVLRQHTRND